MRTSPTVVIPTVHGVDCVAGHVLHAEGVGNVHLRDVGDRDTAYSDLIGNYWRDGRTFILLEDDMAPWPGAIDQLRRCPEPWCRFDYSIGFGRFGLGTLGCMKFGEPLLRTFPDLWLRWEGVHWRNLDATIVKAICDVRGGPTRDQLPADADAYLARCHTHTPAIAHAKHYRHAC